MHDATIAVRLHRHVFIFMDSFCSIHIQNIYVSVTIKFFCIYSSLFMYSYTRPPPPNSYSIFKKSSIGDGIKDLLNTFNQIPWRCGHLEKCLWAQYKVVLLFLKNSMMVLKNLNFSADF
jgi:hypothetical protein